MFTWLGGQLASVLDSYVLQVVTRCMAALAPVAASLMTGWVLLYGWAVLRNEVAQTLPAFLWRVTQIGLILAFALQSAVYLRDVADTASALANGMATTFLPANTGAPVPASPYALLDLINDQASQQVADLMREASITRLDLVLAAALFSIGAVAFLCVGVFVVTVATVFQTFVVGVGPVFVLCLAWAPTRRFFDSWLSMLLSSVVLSWFAFFALGTRSASALWTRCTPCCKAPPWVSAAARWGA